MTRVPARPTLKLPVKTTPAESGEAASKGRKPVRSGFKAPKPTVAQRAKRHETIATRSAAQKARALFPIIFSQSITIHPFTGAA